MSQKSYEHWVINDGVDPEDGDKGQQNRGAAAKQAGEWGWGAGRYPSRWWEGDNQRVRESGRAFWGRGRRQRGYRGRFKDYGMGNQFHFHIF